MKFKNKMLEKLWGEVASAKVRCGIASITSEKNYELFQQWQNKLLQIENEILLFNKKGDE